MLRFPHHLSDSQLVLLVLLLAVIGGLICLYNAYRMGKLRWKPKGPANLRLVIPVILTGIILCVVLLAVVG